MAFADDDAGVKRISILGEYLCVRCSNALGVTETRTVAPKEESNGEDPDVGVGDKAKKRRIVIMTIKPGDFCDPDFSPIGVAGRGFVAIGENFHSGQTTTASFTFETDLRCFPDFAASTSEQSTRPRRPNR